MASLLFAPESERTLVTRVLLDPALMSQAKDLEPEDFSAVDYQKAWAYIREMYLEGRTFDMVTTTEATGVTLDILELSPASFASVEEYVNAIKAAAFRRKVVNSLQQAISKITLDTTDPIGTVSGIVGGLVEGRSTGNLRDSREVVRSYSDVFVTRHAGSGLAYGIPAIDSTLLPMQPGRLVVFASRPGIGKTALAETISDAAAHHGPVLFVSLEMGAEELTDRAMARASGIKAGALMRGEVELARIDEHLRARADLPITYLDDGMTTTSDVLSAAYQVKAANDGALSLLVVDYLQLLADKSTENEVIRVGHIAHNLKRIALRLRVPVLALAQLNRSMEHESRAPRLSDLRESGVIEQDADVVGVITGDVFTPQRDLFILKQRAGHVGRVSLLFDGDTQRWSTPGDGGSEW